MAKIDTSLIQGYADMTAEQKLEALEGFEFADPDFSKYVKKEQYDKTASELASWKKKYNSKLSEDEQAQESQKNLLEQMEAELNSLRRDKKVSEYTAKYVSAGYEAELAAATAEALADGDMEKVFANQASFIKAHDKGLRAEILKDTPKPGGTGGADNPKVITTFAEFDKLTYTKQLAFIKDHPNWKTELK